MEDKPRHAAHVRDDAWEDLPPSEPRVRPVTVSHKKRSRQEAKRRRGSAPSAAPSTVRAAQSRKRKRNPIGVFFRFVGSVAAIAALAVIVAGGALAITEFRPRSIEPVAVSGSVEAAVQDGQQLSLLTWNIGYAGLPASADSFVDGGQGVRAQSEEAVSETLSSIEGEIADQSADIVLLQEVDRGSDRSFSVDQAAGIGESLGEGYSQAFASDYDVLYVPYPWPCLGKVDSGLMTASSYAASSSERVALEKGDSWLRDLVAPEPCLLVSEYRIEGSSKKLVVMNVRFSDRVSQDVQEAQAEQLALLMKREADKGNYVIAGGDFDQSFSGVDVSAYAKDGSQVRSTGVIDQDAFAKGMQFAMDPSVPTARSLNAALEGDGDNVRFYVSDGFIMSSNVKLGKVQTIDAGFANSDHNPVRLEVTLD